MIKEYELTPYPRKMWVAKGENFDQIKDQFDLSDEDYSLTNEEIEDSWNAVVFTCSKDDYAGYLVFITDKHDHGDLVHEALHVSMNVYEECSIQIASGMDQEPLCYLTEHIWRLLVDEK